MTKLDSIAQWIKVKLVSELAMNQVRNTADNSRAKKGIAVLDGITFLGLMVVHFLLFDVSMCE